MGTMLEHPDIAYIMRTGYGPNDPRLKEETEEEDYEDD